MRVIYCLSVFIFLLCGCINTNTDSKSKSELEEKLYPLSKEDTELNLDTLQEYAPDFNGYVYIMNSDCSSCIAEFLSFAKELAESEYNGDLLVIISNATQPIINHYIKQYDFYKKINILLIENKQRKWGIKSVEEMNGMVYVIEQSQIKSVYQYFPE